MATVTKQPTFCSDRRWVCIMQVRKRCGYNRQQGMKMNTQVHGNKLAGSITATENLAAISQLPKLCKRIEY